MKSTQSYYHTRIIIFLSLLCLCACGGGGGTGGGSIPSTIVTPPPAPPALPPIVFDTAEFRENYSLDQMKAGVAYSNGASGNGIVVAVIDSGVTVVPELVGQLHADSTNVSALGNPSDVGDFNGHGTAMASIIAALQDHDTNNDPNNMHGVAFNSKILAINATTAATCTSFSNCTFLHSDIAAGYDYARTHGAKVINESLGSNNLSSLALQQAVERAVNDDIVIVVPAGNIDAGDPAGTGDAVQRSAEVALASWANGQIIIAGSVDSNDVISGFSYKAGAAARNFYLMAGGQSITTPNGSPGTGSTYFLISGTSASTAQISGAVALLREAFPSLSANETADLLFTTATDLGAPGVDDIYGRGLLNLQGAFTAQGNTVIAGTGFGSGAQIGTGGGSSSLMIAGGAFGADMPFSSSFNDIMVLDKYDRSFSLDLTQSVYTGQAALSLEGFLDGGTQHRQQAFSLSDRANMKLAWRSDDQFEDINKGYFNLQSDRDKTVSDLRMLLSFQIDDDRSAKVSSGMSIAEMLEDYRPDDFMTPNKHGFESLVSPNNNRAVAYKTMVGKNTAYQVAFSNNNIKYDPLLFAQNIRVRNSLLLNRFSHQATDQLSLVFDIGMLQEQGSVLGSVSRGAMEIGRGARTAFVGGRVDFKISNSIELFARASYGITDVEASFSGILGNISTLKSHSYLIGLKKSALFLNNDQFSLTFSQPLLLSGGNASISKVLSRDYVNDVYNMSLERLSLTPTGRERDIEISYGVGNLYGRSVRLNVLHQINPGHSQNIPDATTFLLRLGSVF